MNSIKVDWDEVTEKYNWFIVNNVAEGYVCKKKPTIRDNNWNAPGGWDNCEFSGSYSDWRETLQQRPSKTTIVAPQENTDYSVHIHLDSDTDSLTYCGKLSKEQIARLVEVVYES